MSNETLLLWIGIFWVGLGLFLFIQRQRTIHKGERTTGTIVDFHEQEGENHPVFFPIIEFTTRQGQTVRVTYSLGSYPPSRKLGQQVTVYYQPDNPQKFKIAPGLDEYILYGSMMMIGFASIFFSL